MSLVNDNGVAMPINYLVQREDVTVIREGGREGGRVRRRERKREVGEKKEKQTENEIK